MVWFHAGQAEVESLKTEGETSMINAHELQDGGLQIVHVNGVLGDVKAELIGLT